MLIDNGQFDQSAAWSTFQKNTHTFWYVWPNSEDSDVKLRRNFSVTCRLGMFGMEKLKNSRCVNRNLANNRYLMVQIFIASTLVRPYRDFHANGFPFPQISLNRRAYWCRFIWIMPRNIMELIGNWFCCRLLSFPINCTPIVKCRYDWKREKYIRRNLMCVACLRQAFALFARFRFISSVPHWFENRKIYAAIRV